MPRMGYAVTGDIETGKITFFCLEIVERQHGTFNFVVILALMPVIVKFKLSYRNQSHILIFRWAKFIQVIFTLLSILDVSTKTC